MTQSSIIQGFSRLSKDEKLNWVASFLPDPEQARSEMAGFWYSDPELQRILDGFSENTISNFPMPMGIVPNLMLNDRLYAVPMVIEESSVVAAASSAAKFWLDRGGFHAEVVNTVKLGQVHFRWSGQPQRREALLADLRHRLRAESAYLTENMEKRGGGLLDIEWLHLPEIAPDYYQLRASFDTRDSMGANFINSVLEQMAETLESWAAEDTALYSTERELEVIMSILSNYTPECLVRAWVSCPIRSFDAPSDGRGEYFARRFQLAVRIAQEDPYRAVTHNKGIFNGIDAVVLATGNDFRAIEACAHAYAARNGRYSSLSSCTISEGEFRFELEVPLALGTVGGLTRLHPLAKRSLELLGNPSAAELMQIMAATGLAQNFAAVRSLVTTGIQQGHMKMHLQNILNHLGATAQQCEQAREFFSDRVVSFSAVRSFLNEQ